MVFSLSVWVQAQASDSSHLAQALKRTISLDLDMSDWEGLPEYLIELSNAEEPTLVKETGYFSLAWDDDYLYVKGVFEQAEASLSIGLAEDSKEWWLGDTLEVFIRLAPEQRFHYASSPDATRFVAFLTDNNYQSLSQLDALAWTLQLAFPLSGSSLPAIQTGDSWEFKIGRGNSLAKEYSLWPMGGDFLGESNYGLVYFTEQIESDSIVFDKLSQ